MGSVWGMFIELKPRLLRPVNGLAVISFGALVVLLQTAAALAEAGTHADATATLTPSNEDLWIRAVLAFAVLLTTAVALIAAQVRSRYPVVVTISALLLALGLSLLAFGVYWWWAAGSYADMAHKEVPRSEWRSLPVTGSALLASALFGVTTVYLLAKRNTD